MSENQFENIIDRTLERIDDLNVNGWRIYQNSGLFRFGIDAVLLSGYAAPREGEAVIDLCSGTGVIPFILLAKNRVKEITALEYFEYFCSLIEKTARLNSCADRIKPVCEDVRNVGRIFVKNSFDVVTVNPPYEKNGHGIDSKNGIINAARRETLCDIGDIARAAAHLLRPAGRLYMIHRPSRLCDVFCALRQNGLEPRRYRLVQSYADSAPSMVLLWAVKGGAPYLEAEKNLVIYDKNGGLTAECAAFYGREAYERV